jgi:chromosome condensin MukBEF complex kleisin-like MukF subunit
MARNVTSLLQKILDKILAMTAISIALCPGYTIYVHEYICMYIFV